MCLKTQRAFQTRLMEVYAGFLEHADTQYGKIVDELEAQGILDNTLIFYIGSDNGASAEGQAGTISELLAQNLMATTVEEQIEVLERDYGGLDALGSELLDSMYHHGWAWAGDTPFKSTKLVAAHFGGTRTPMVVSWPKRIKPDATPRSQFHHVNDLAATVYDILGIDPPYAVDGVEQDPLDGVSMAYSFDDPKRPGPERRSSTLTSTPAAASTRTAGLPAPLDHASRGIVPAPRSTSWNPDEDVWELYNLDEDYSQANDLAEKMPEKLQAMKDTFTMQATENKVFPIGGAFYTSALHPEEIRASTLTEWTFFPGQTRIPESMAPKFVSGFSSLAIIDADVPEGASGVLFCVGGLSGGFTVFMDARRAVRRVQHPGRLPLQGPLDRAHSDRRSEDRSRAGLRREEAAGAGHVILRVNGKQVGQGRVERSVPAGFTASETFDIGIDLGSPVSLDYHERAPFAFTGTIERIRFAYL